MTREEKDLLLKDISARLPYRVKVQSYSYEDDVETIETLREIDSDGYMATLECETLKHIAKPYLFPLSSMTEEQKIIYGDLCYQVICSSKGLINSDVMEYVNWCYKNHIDINNLIPKRLAWDATNLNIY